MCLGLCDLAGNAGYGRPRLTSTGVLENTWFFWSNTMVCLGVALGPLKTQWLVSIALQFPKHKHAAWRGVYLGLF
jgi:hypothetical protein